VPIKEVSNMPIDSLDAHDYSGATARIDILREENENGAINPILKRASPQPRLGIARTTEAERRYDSRKRFLLS